MDIQKLEQAMEPIIIDPYMMFYERAKTMYKDEQAIQSATASMFIRYSNLADKNPHFSEMLKSIKESVATSQPKADGYRELYFDAIRYIYAPLIERYANVAKFIEVLFERHANDGWTIEEYDDAIADYLNRNNLPPMPCIVPKTQIKTEEVKQ